MDIRIKPYNLLCGLSLIFLLFPLFFSSLSGVLIPSGLIRCAMSVIGMGGVILLQFKRFRFYSLPYYCYIVIAAIILIVVWGALQVNPITSNLESTVRYVALMISFLFIYNDRRWLNILFKLLFLFSAFYVITTIWLYYDTNSYFTYFADHLYPNNVNYDFMNGYLEGFTAGVTDHYSTNGMMLANAIMCFFSFTVIKKDNKRISIISAVFFVLSIIAMVLTGKRAHLLFSLAAIGCGMIVYLSKDKNGSVKFILLFIAIVAILFIVINTSTKLQNVLARFEDMSEDGNITSRYAFWEQALRYFNENKLIGIGWNDFWIVSATGQHVHNCYIQILTESGLIGAMVFYPFFIYSFVISFKWLLFVLRNKKNYSRNVLITSIFSFCYQIYFLAYCLTGNPLFDMYCYALYYIGSFACIAFYKEYYRKRKTMLVYSCDCQRNVKNYQSLQ